MQAIEQAAPAAPTQQFQPGITWLNMSGDVTITWDDSNREAILELVRQKLKQGYAFFIITPRFLPMFGNKQVKLTDPAQLDKAVGVVVADDQVADIVGKLAPATAQTKRLGDDDVERVVRNGQAELANVPKAKLETTRRAASAEEVLQHQSVAVRPISGG